MSVRRGRTTGPRRGPLVTLLVLGALVAGACSDGGPEGPGPVSATGGGPAMGAAVVQITGVGVTGFEGAGSSRVIDAETGPDTYRVVVVAETPGELHFRILVQDRAGVLPTGVVLSAVDGSNVPFATTTGISLQVAR